MPLTPLLLCVRPCLLSCCRAPPVPAASCEVVAFALGSLTSMPALRNFSGGWVDFALCVPAVPPQNHIRPPLTSYIVIDCTAVCAALAVLLDFLLQVTAFVALLALDTQRRERGSSSSSGGSTSGGAQSWGAM